MLFQEFYGQPQIAQPAIRTAAEYVETHWAKLSPKFREKYNLLRTARRLPPIPDPEVDLYERPTPAKAPQFPWERYLTATALFSEYATGERAESFETACRKVLEPYRAQRR
jgi:hypothetical protein